MTESPPGPHLSGQFFTARLEFLHQRYGAACIPKVMEALPHEDRERLKGLERTGWYPFGTLIRFDREVARLLDPGDPAIFERLGAASSRVRNEWLGEHASLMNPHAFLSLAADEHPRFHSFGRASYRRTGFDEGEISFADYPEIEEAWCLGGLGYLRATLELLTSGPVTVEERRCQCRGDAACVFWLRWNGVPERSGEPDPAGDPPSPTIHPGGDP